MKVLIVYYSMYGHIYKMAEAIAEGVKQVNGAEVKMYRVPETLPDDVLEKMGALDFQKKTAQIDVCTADDLVSADESKRFLDLVQRLPQLSATELGQLNVVLPPNKLTCATRDERGIF